MGRAPKVSASPKWECQDWAGYTLRGVLPISGSPLFSTRTAATVMASALDNHMQSAQSAPEEAQDDEQCGFCNNIISATRPLGITTRSALRRTSLSH